MKRMELLVQACGLLASRPEKVGLEPQFDLTRTDKEKIGLDSLTRTDSLFIGSS